MNQKKYMREVYSQSWITAREKHYGFMEYDKNLCKFIQREVKEGSKLLDVACGTGYPFAAYFQQSGYQVYGMDIAPNLIEKCRQLYPDVISTVGDAENLDYPDNTFDCTYCFHSSWYFPDLTRVIDEMLRVTRKGGLVMLDIQNRRNKDIEKSYRRRKSLASRLLWYAVVIKRFVLSGMSSSLNWKYIIYEVPTYPETIYEYVHNRHDMISGFIVMGRKPDESLEVMDNLAPFEEYGRLVFAIGK
jgi:ubiquinone/menaquinone biosynthesis C-methylase UbiE